jgi:hypothetical protein
MPQGFLRLPYELREPILREVIGDYIIILHAIYMEPFYHWDCRAVRWPKEPYDYEHHQVILKMGEKKIDTSLFYVSKQIANDARHILWSSSSLVFDGLSDMQRFVKFMQQRSSKHLESIHSLQLLCGCDDGPCCQITRWVKCSEFSLFTGLRSLRLLLVYQVNPENLKVVRSGKFFDLCQVCKDSDYAVLRNMNLDLLLNVERHPGGLIVLSEMLQSELLVQEQQFLGQMEAALLSK